IRGAGIFRRGGRGCAEGAAVPAAQPDDVLLAGDAGGDPGAVPDGGVFACPRRTGRRARAGAGSVGRVCIPDRNGVCAADVDEPGVQRVRHRCRRGAVVFHGAGADRASAARQEPGACHVAGAETVILFFAAWMIGGPPIPWTVAATLIGLTFGLLCDFSAGNLVSLYLPKKIDLSRLGRQNARGTTGLIALALQGGMALLVAVAVGGGILFHRVWLSLSLLALLAALAAAAYWLVLQRVDGIAAGRRETLTAELSKA